MNATNRITNATQNDRDISIQSAGRDPFNHQSRFVWVSRSGRFCVRAGNYGTMIVTDRRDGNRVHIVIGKIPAVAAFLAGQTDAATEDEMRANMRKRA